MIGEGIYGLGPRDLAQYRLEVVHQSQDDTSAGLVTQNCLFQPPEGRALLLQHVFGVGITVGPREVRQVTIEVATFATNQLRARLLEKFFPAGTGGTLQALYAPLPNLVITDDLRVWLRVTYDLASASNLTRLSVSGILVPKGNLSGGGLIGST